MTWLDYLLVGFIAAVAICVVVVVILAWNHYKIGQEIDRYREGKD